MRAAQTEVDRFIQAVLSGDTAGLRSTISSLSESGSLNAAFRRLVRRDQRAHDDVRTEFAAHWKLWGDVLRDDLNDDLLLIDGLRLLLPAYEGSTTTLFRGDSARNRRRRTYGLSWSGSLEIARDFAVSVARRYEGGSVLLQVDAPPSAIVFSPGMQHDMHGEDEFVLDRRFLSTVTVVERFA